MNKMGAEYVKELERKFGNALPSMDALCNICGKDYGEHLGTECPTLPPTVEELEEILKYVLYTPDGMKICVGIVGDTDISDKWVPEMREYLLKLIG